MNKNLIKNILSLISVQGANYIIPLMTLPYLVRVLGPVGYGGLSFSLAFIQYFVLLSDYGFNLSATKQIAVIKNEKYKVSKLFWNVMTCRCILLAFGFLLLIFVSGVFDKINGYRDILFYAYFMVLGNVLFPIWLFQGKEKMGMIAIANISAKMLAIPLIFFLVKSNTDANIAALISGCTFVLSGVIALLAIKKYGWIEWVQPSFLGVKQEFKLGWHIFLSTAAISLYTVTTTVILGVIAGPVAVGYFVAADKIRQAAQGLITPISQAIYPRINALMASEPIKAYFLIRKLLIIQGGGTFLLSLSLFLLAKPIILIAYHSSYIPSIIVLKWLAWLPFIIGLSNVFGIQTLLTLGLNFIFSRILIISGIVSLVFIFPLTDRYAQNGAAVTIFITEIFVTAVMLIVILKRKIPIFRKKIHEI
ncbi:flippase [Tolumonas lignilytica]|uniref:flippase n=1 Tax=Tolumonas lignilytica TaxID=1283284 RepID=UPI000467B894|nr:flippase [Tolumonas lignilytica]